MLSPKWCNSLYKALAEQAITKKNEFYNDFFGEDFLNGLVEEHISWYSRYKEMCL
ncbi:hypothetical protein GW12_15900 [Acinetobacter sp. HR7]|nr:hypothetical protein GW12_15900 [Acinetobacter sp. HR7]